MLRNVYSLHQHTRIKASKLETIEDEDETNSVKKKVSVTDRRIENITAVIHQLIRPLKIFFKFSHS